MLPGEDADGSLEEKAGELVCSRWRLLDGGLDADEHVEDVLAYLEHVGEDEHGSARVRLRPML